MITKDKPNKSAGYRVERVYVGEQSYKVLDDAELELMEETEGDERSIRFGWDWRPVAARRFEVALEIITEAKPDSAERAQVRVMGIFEAGPGEPAVPFADFIRINAPAILFPFAREVISAMTGRGPFGAFHIDPVNVPALLSEVDLEETTGARYLKANEELADSFELDYRRVADQTSSTLE